MKIRCPRLALALMVSALAVVGPALTQQAPPPDHDRTPPPASPALANASDSAQGDLDKSLQELAALRESIRAEKIPMTQELGRLEGQLADLRRRYEEVSRRQDTQNLEAGNIAGALKLRQDEYTYVANLIDEFGHNLESDLHVSEHPRYDPLLEAATKAHNNSDLAPVEKLGPQVELLKASETRLDGMLGGIRYPGQAVDPQGKVADGEFAMVGPVVVFAGVGGIPAGLALPQSGSARAAIRPLEAALNAGLQKIVTTGEGLLPLDPSRGGALKELIGRGNLIGYFKKGGPIMYPLLLVSILALTVLIERFTFLARERHHRDWKAVRGILAMIETGDVEGAIEKGRQSRDFVARALTYAMKHREKALSDALMRASSQELIRYTRGISILDTIVTMAPLLGLLGTVTGMMGSFGMLGGAELSAPGQITGGIAEALIATAFGLSIAVTALIPMNYLHSRAEKARHEMEDACTHLEVLMKPITEAEAELVQDQQRTRLSQLAAAGVVSGATRLSGVHRENPSLSPQEGKDRDRPSH